MAQGAEDGPGDDRGAVVGFQFLSVTMTKLEWPLEKQQGHSREPQKYSTLEDGEESYRSRRAGELRHSAVDNRAPTGTEGPMG